MRGAGIFCVWVILPLIGAGCAVNPLKKPTAPFDPQLFGAVSRRIHPIFTEIEDWTGDGRPDGVEALIEFQDRFGDPTKVAGTIIFELYEYRPYHPDPRGRRIASPFYGSLQSLDEQKARWNRTSRTYQFQLACGDRLRNDRDYVLAASFDYGAGRFFDQVVLEARRPRRDEQTVSPDEQPEGSVDTPATRSSAATRP
jgi:hypothetical protein